MKKRISSTLISNLLNESECPFKIKTIYIDKTHKSEPTKAMIMGLFFEQQVLGKKENGEEIIPPRLKNKSESTDEKRIKEQAEKIKKEIFPYYGIDLEAETSNPFVRFELDFPEDGIVLTGEFDLLCKLKDPLEGEVNAIVDLKLTKNINYENINNGGWSWRYPQNRDHTQAYMYYYAYKQLFPNEPAPKFYYMVADYKPTPEFKMFKKRVDKLNLLELKNSIQQTSDKIDQYNITGWPYIPSYKNCITCPLKNTCLFAIKKQPIQEI